MARRLVTGLARFKGAAPDLAALLRVAQRTSPPAAELALVGNTAPVRSAMLMG